METVLLIHCTDSKNSNFLVLKKLNNDWYLLTKDKSIVHITDNQGGFNAINHLQCEEFNLEAISNKYLGAMNILYRMNRLQQNEKVDIQKRQSILQHFYEGVNYKDSIDKWNSFLAWLEPPKQMNQMNQAPAINYILQQEAQHPVI